LKVTGLNQASKTSFYAFRREMNTRGTFLQLYRSISAKTTLSQLVTQAKDMDHELALMNTVINLSFHRRQELPWLHV